MGVSYFHNLAVMVHNYKRVTVFGHLAGTLPPGATFWFHVFVVCVFPEEEYFFPGDGIYETT